MSKRQKSKNVVTLIDKLKSIWYNWKDGNREKRCGGNMSKSFIVTSFKGGVGKTTLSANLAMSLARRGHKVVAVDCDLESRCLDIVLGLENATLFNICDCIKGTCTVDNALVRDTRCENLYFISAPAFYPERHEIGTVSESFSQEAINRFVKELTNRFDYVIFDLPARPDNLYRNLALLVDAAFVVSLHTAASIRAAEKTAIALNELTGYGSDNMTAGGLDIRLIVNGFKCKDAKQGINVGLYDIISKTKLRLWGVVPFSVSMSKAQEMGKLAHEIYNGTTPFCRAVENIASRCEGYKVPLFSGVDTGVNKKQVF